MLKASAQCQDHLMQHQLSGKICQKKLPRLMSIKTSRHGFELTRHIRTSVSETFYTFIHMVCLKPLTHLLHSDLHKSNQTETCILALWFHAFAVQTTNN